MGGILNHGYFVPQFSIVAKFSLHQLEISLQPFCLQEMFWLGCIEKRQPPPQKKTGARWFPSVGVVPTRGHYVFET